jgi:hypothetical protein
MIQHPIRTPYYVYLRAKEGHSGAVYENQEKAFGSNITGDLELGIPINIMLKDIRTFTIWARRRTRTQRLPHSLNPKS